MTCRLKRDDWLVVLLSNARFRCSAVVVKQTSNRYDGREEASSSDAEGLWST